MTSFARAQAIEEIVGYKFRSRHDDVLKALTAAGAVEEDWDGNRKLAQLGTALSEFLLNYLAFEAGITRAYASDFKEKVTSNEHRACVAKRTGISKHIRFNKRGGAESSSVLAKAVNAVIAVIFFDCGQDISVVLRTMRHLGIFTLAGQSINPTLLSLDELPNSLDVASLARSLFSVDTRGQSLSSVAGIDRILLTSSSTQQHATTDIRPSAAGTEISKVVAINSQWSHIQNDHSFNNTEANVEPEADHSFIGSTQILSAIVAEREEASTCRTVGAAGRSERVMQKRTKIHRGVSQRRKKLRGSDTHPNVDVLGTYLTEEERKCQAWGHRTPQNTFLTPPIQQAIKNLGKGKTEVLAKILIHIGSPCLIGALQDILESCKTREEYMALQATSTPSKAERVQLIASLDHAMSRFQLLRRYHVLQLFKDCGGPGTSTWGILMTPSSPARPPNTRGNPLNRSVADVTARMMRDTFPNVDSSTDDYKTKYRWISDIRRLGQRLHMLETRFGEGFLGLMLDQGLAGTDVGITDKMIMTPTDLEYTEFVGILDKSQGDLLRDLGRAILPAVKALTLGGVHEQGLFNMEKITVDDIAKYPKGSLAFLQLINEAV